MAKQPVTKERLQQYAGLLQEIDDQIERLERMESALCSASSSNMDGMPHNGFAVDLMAIAICRKIDLEKMIKENLEKERQEIKELEDAVQGLRKPYEKLVIRLKYFDRLEWPAVCEAIFGIRADYEEKLESYMRRTFRIHGTALVSLLDETGGTSTDKDDAEEENTPEGQ